MNSLQQYLDLYRENARLIDSNSADALNRLRPDALNALQGKSLPTQASEDYERTSIDKMMAPDFGLNIGRVDIPVDVTASFRCNVPNMSTLLAFTVNDIFKPTQHLADRLSDGVRFMSLKKAASEMPDIVARHYGSASPIEDPLVALNSLLVQDGVFIYVPDGVTVNRPLQLVNIFNATIPALAAMRRVLIVLGKGARCQFLTCDHTQDAVNSYLSSQVTEIILGEGASLDYCEIEESSAMTSRAASLYVEQSAASRFSSTTVTLTCGNTRNNMTVNLNGEGCITYLGGMAVNSDKRHIDNCTRVNHNAPRCKSDQKFKYVLDDESTGAFEGTILVTGDAPFTQAYQSNRNILASPVAKMHTKPQLLIYNDDVKCSHGATTGQLDNEALFYMRTRGIPEKEARTMLMQAFMSDIIEGVSIEGLRDRLRHLVKMRFHGTDSFCENCGGNIRREQCNNDSL